MGYYTNNGAKCELCKTHKITRILTQDADDVDPEIEDCLMSEYRDLPDDQE